ncbi:nuclear GTPase SLIP-GC-like [Platysternon megacephalum]|uniref:Nuclear GTPase SLIP-GC-like n=1 Tax=Platysternon megacephalum TaxID=55544 RepID=A0A4D9DYZ0_9SAUR|nr:nuclear GTPase SLIP-GC-like [Platysternon megacephalum]
MQRIAIGIQLLLLFETSCLQSCLPSFFPLQSLMQQQRHWPGWERAARAVYSDWQAPPLIAVETQAPLIGRKLRHWAKVQSPLIDVEVAASSAIQDPADNGIILIPGLSSSPRDWGVE